MSRIIPTPITKNELDLDHTPLTFGRYRGQTPDEVSEHDPSYVVWMYNNIKPEPCSEWLKETCENEVSNMDDDDETKECYGD